MLLLLLLSGSARADGEATTRYLLYADDDATTVSTALVDASVDLPFELSLGTQVLVDVVSSASVDVVSAATGRWTETRTEASARIGANVAKADLAASYTHSQENDWASHSMQIGAGREFLQRNLRLEASGALTLNQVGRAQDPNFAESMRVSSGQIGASQLIDARSRAGLSVGLQDVRGYQGSPYRYVTSLDGARMLEKHPDKRQRTSISAYGLRSINRWLSVRANYRYYLDSWGVRSHTTALRLRFDLGDSLHLAIGARYYRQRAAEFYRETYAGPLKHMSRDRELSRFWDVGTTSSLGAQLGPVTVDAKLGLLHYRFANFAPLTSRLALIAGAGASLPW